MKLVDQYIDPDAAAAARRRLREAGIASRVDSMDPHSVQPSKSGTTHIGLWVLDDEQFEDALRALEDPAYLVQRKLSPNEIDRLEASAEKGLQPGERLARNAMTLLLFLCLLGLVVFTAVDFFIGL